MRRRTPDRYLCLTVAALALLGGGCSSSRGRGAGPVEIVYWTGWSGHELEVQQALVDEFNRTHPDVRVRMLTQFNNTGSYQKVRIAFAGGATPDVMSTVWADELPSYAMRGVLTPLDDFLRRSGRDLEKEFSPGVARMLRIDGHVYGLAATTNTSFIAYNKRIFREVGLDPENPPRTVAELDAAARACTRIGRDGSFARYGFRPGDLRTWAYVFGGGWYDTASRRITASDPRNLAALRWLASYGKSYDLRKMQAFEASFGSDQTANGPFFVGKIAMWNTGEWAAAFIRRYAPNLEWGWFALPSPPGGRPNLTMAGGSVFVIPEACRSKEAAWEFLNWFTSPHAVRDFCWGIQNIAPVLEAGQDPVFQSDPLFRFATAIAHGQNSFGPPPIPIWPTYTREIRRVEEAAMLGGEDPERLLDGLQRRMEREMTEAMEDLRR